MTDQKRMCLIQDDSSHWYCIPAELKKRFDLLLPEIEREGYSVEFDNLFDGMRLAMHPSNYSFVDLQEIPDGTSGKS